MKHKFLSAVSVLVCALTLMFSQFFASADDLNGNWAEKTATLKNTSEAKFSVRVGDIDACNDEVSVSESGYNPFTAKDQYAHGFSWVKDENDPEGTDRIYVGSHWRGDSQDGYSSCYVSYKAGEEAEKDHAFGDGALTLTMRFDASGITVKNALLQLCIDDFQPLSFESHFTVTLNGKDAPFVAELLNHVDQTGPTSYIVSAMIPSGFFEDIASGSLAIVIDETTGCGDGYAVDFAKLLINYDENVFTGSFSGTTEPGATVRLLGTSTTVTASQDGGFRFDAIPGLNAVRASKKGYAESYEHGIVLSAGSEWEPDVPLYEGEETPDIDFSKFGVTGGSETSGSESASANGSESADVESTESIASPGEKQKCKVCGICPVQPLGICLFIWIAIILLLLIIIVIVACAVKKNKNKKEKK